MVVNDIESEIQFGSVGAYMNRLAGIITAVAGFIFALLGILKLLPGWTGTGIVGLLVGVLVIGLSFINKPDTEGVERMPTGSTLLNIFISPTEVFRNLRFHPRWLVAMLVISILSGVYVQVFTTIVTPERIIGFTTEKTLEIGFIDESAKSQIRQAEKDQVEEAKKPVVRAGQFVTGIASGVLWPTFFALVYFLFVLVMGGRINWWQSFATAVYAAFPVTVIQNVLNLIIVHLKSPDEIHPIIGQRTLVQDNLGFLVTAAEHPVIYTLLSTIGILGFYWIWLTATGLKNAGERVSSGTAWTASIGTYAILVIFSLIMAALFPSFIS